MAIMINPMPCMCRRTSLEPLANATEDGVRVIAIDRPPFGLSQRPRTWEGGDQGSPYTNEVGLGCSQQ